MKLTFGRVVHYVLPCCSDDFRVRPNAMGEHRAALVVSIRNNGRPVLHVLLDECDGRDGEPFITVVGAEQDEVDKIPGSWHWREREE